MYGVSEASRLVGVSSPRIRRWLVGYRYSYRGQTRWSDPLWKSEVLRIEGATSLDFLDLMEIRFVNAFRSHGVSWTTIRIAAERAGTLFGSDHPFSAAKFSTDGQTIFAELLEETGESALLDLVKSQYAFRRVIAPSLRGVEYSEDNRAVRWWPLGSRRNIVLDPSRSFGTPIVKREGVPTSVIGNAFEVEQSIDVVARWYDVDQKAVRDAIEFEERIAA